MSRSGGHRVGMLSSRLQFHEDKSLAKQEIRTKRPRTRIGSREREREENTLGRWRWVGYPYRYRRESAAGKSRHSITTKGKEGELRY